jgi:hypothetical protein
MRSSMCLAFLGLGIFVGAAHATERGWFPPELFFSGNDQTQYADIVLPEEGEEFSVFIWQGQGNTLWIAGAQFGLAPESLEILDLIPKPEFVNQGSITSPILMHTDCFNDNRYFKPLAEVRLRLLDSSGGNLCFVPSDQLGINCSFDCVSEHYYNHFSYGYWFGTGNGCDCCTWSDLCGDPLSNEPSTWGKIKSAYR